jgi:hypothetical protein
MGANTELALSEIAPRLAIDLAAIFVLAIGLSFRRHRRRDLVVLFVIFNVGLFAAVTVIGAGGVTAAVGFGLFAVLSIIRLRAESLAPPDIAYFFAAIVLGLVTGVDVGALEATALLALLVLAGPAVADASGLLPAEHRMEMTLEQAVADRDALQALVEDRLGTRVIGFEVLDLDFVRETTRVDVRVAQNRSGHAP